jgi:hypothetical protein
MNHHYVYVDDNGGVCACGAELTWYGRISGPRQELANHIQKVNKDEQ